MYLWCHAGTCGQDFESALQLLITACWAQDIKVITNDSHQQFVTLDGSAAPMEVRNSRRQHRPDASRKPDAASDDQHPSPAHDKATLKNVNGERRGGEVTFWIDDTYCLICDLDTGEDFYFTRNMLIYPQA